MGYFTANDGVELHYKDVGSGNPIILVHGAFGSSAHFDDLTPRLSEHYRVICPDLRGMGKSSRVDEMKASAWVDDVIQLVDHLEIERFAIAGTSLGARIAMRVALLDADRVQSLVIDGSIMRNEPAGERALDEFLRPDTMSQADAARIEALQGPDWADVVTFYRRIRSMPELQAFYDLYEDVEKIVAPVLISRGDQDDVIHPVSHSLHAYRALADSWLWIAPNTGFSAMRGRPEEFERIYEEFLKQ